MQRSRVLFTSALLAITAAFLAPAAVPTAKAPGAADPAAPRTRPGGLRPAEALTRFTAGTGLKVEQVLAEPTVAQPVSLTFDERGRMWVVQYRQYPNPAGLKMVSR